MISLLILFVLAPTWGSRGSNTSSTKSAEGIEVTRTRKVNVEFLRISF